MNAPAHSRSFWLPMAGLSLAMLLSSLGTSVANVALPTLTKAFDVSFQAAQWIVLAYLLATTTVIVSAGRLGDIVGRRRLLMVGMATFGLASIACGLAPSLWVLVASRTIQGVGAAIMMALTLAFVGETVPKESTGSAMGLLGTMSAIGTALGPSLGGLVIALLGWRAIFLANAPLALIALVLAARYLPASSRPMFKDRPGFDARGTTVLALTLAAYALAMTIGRGSFGLGNVLLLAGAITGLVLFVGVQMRARSPLIRLEMLREPVLSAGLGMSALVSTVMMTTLVVGPFYLSRGLGLGPALVGLVMSVGPIVVASTGMPVGRIVDRVGPAFVTVAGLAAMTAGALSLALIPTSVGLIGYLPPIVIITLGYAAFQTANNTAVMKDVGADQRGVVSGMLNLSRNLGLITGASVMGAVFAFGAGTSAVSDAAPGDIATGMRSTFAVAAVLLAVALTVAIRAQAFVNRMPEPVTA